MKVKDLLDILDLNQEKLLEVNKAYNKSHIPCSWGYELGSLEDVTNWESMKAAYDKWLDLEIEEALNHDQH